MHPNHPPQAPLSCRSPDLKSGYYDPLILVDTYYLNPCEYRHQNVSVPLARSSTSIYENPPSTAQMITERQDPTYSFAPPLIHVNMNPWYHECTRPSVPGTGSSTVIPTSHSFVRDNPLHFLFSHNNTNTSVPVLPQGVQDASADQATAQSVRPLISFDSNASITAPFNFPATGFPQGMPPLSFLSPIRWAVVPHSHNFVSPYLLLPPTQGVFPPPYQGGQGGVPPPPIPPATLVPQGNPMHAHPTFAPFPFQQFLPQIQYAPYNTSINSLHPTHNNTLHTYNSFPHQLQQPVPLPMVPVVPSIRSIKSTSLSSSTLSIIPTLSEMKDWTTWNNGVINGVINAVRTISGLGHLFEGMSNDPLLQLVYPPPLPEPMKRNLTV